MYSPERHDAYFRWGESAVACIRLALLAAERGNPSSVLDFACGHGRVMRTLKAAFPDALTACDIDRDGVDFCARTFGAAPVYSSATQQRSRSKIDSTSSGSVDVHPRKRPLGGFLRMFESLLQPGGMLVFTTGGRFVIEQMKAGKRSVGLDGNRQPDLIADFERTGLGIGNTSTVPAGVSLGRRPRGSAPTRRGTGLRLAFVERGWLSSQDVISCVRREAPLR